jgi:hypothetical protein
VALMLRKLFGRNDGMGITICLKAIDAIRISV